MLVTYVRQCTFASGLILSPGGFDGRNHSTDRRGARRRIRLSDSRATIGTVDTFHALHEHDHNLAAYCATCERWAVLDLERLIAEGRGEHFFVGRKPRCNGPTRQPNRNQANPGRPLLPPMIALATPHRTQKITQPMRA